MKNLKILLLVLFVYGAISNNYSQKSLPAYNRFSKKKISYVYLTDGTEIKGHIKDIDRKKV